MNLFDCHIFEIRLEPRNILLSYSIINWIMNINTACSFILMCCCTCVSKNIDDNDKRKTMTLERKVSMLYEEVRLSKTRIKELEQKVKECSCLSNHKRKNT